MAIFLDTNVVLYAFIANDPRQPKAIRLLEQEFEISAQVLNEFASVSRRKLGLDWAEVEAGLGLLRAVAGAIHPVTVETNKLGIELAARYQLSVYDAVLLASALLAECGTVYSEYMQDGLVIEDLLTVRNPFA